MELSDLALPQIVVPLLMILYIGAIIISRRADARRYKRMVDSIGDSLSCNTSEFLREFELKAIKNFCEQVNERACENMLKPPYALEGQHKRAMVQVCSALGVELSFSDNKQEQGNVNI